MDHVADKPVEIQATVLENELELSTRPGRLPLNSLRIVCSIVVTERPCVSEVKEVTPLRLIHLGNLRLCKPEAQYGVLYTQSIQYEVLRTVATSQLTTFAISPVKFLVLRTTVVQSQLKPSWILA